MKLAPVSKFMLLFCACFTSVLLLAVYAVISGWLSPRGLGVLLSLGCVIAFVVFWIGMRGIGRKQTLDAPPDRSML
jgi:hypothetical protein